MRLVAALVLVACGREALPPAQPIHLDPRADIDAAPAVKRAVVDKKTIVVYQVAGGDVGAELTFRLRNEVREEPLFQLLPIDRAMIDEAMLHDCDNISPADQHPKKCLIQIGRDAGADYLLWGDLQQDHGAFQARVQLIPIGDPDANRRAIFPIRDKADAEPATHKAWPLLAPP